MYIEALKKSEFVEEFTYLDPKMPNNIINNNNKLDMNKENTNCNNNNNKVNWFLCFNGISTLVGYLKPKLFSQKNSSGTINK